MTTALFTLLLWTKRFQDSTIIPALKYFFLKKNSVSTSHAYSFQNFPSLFKSLSCSARFWVNLAPKPTQRPFQSICRRVLKAFIDYASILVGTWHREQIAFNRRPSCLVVTFVGLRFWTKAPRSGCQAIKCQMVFFSNRLVLLLFVVLCRISWTVICHILII